MQDLRRHDHTYIEIYILMLYTLQDTLFLLEHIRCMFLMAYIKMMFCYALMWRVSV